jgi:hypothetical protein
LRVVAERLVKCGKLTDGPIDELPAFRFVLGIDVGFVGTQHLFGGIRKLRENGLTPDDNQLIVVGNSRRRADEVLEVSPLHEDEAPGV